MYAGSAIAAPDVEAAVPAPFRPLVSKTFGCQSSCIDSAASFALFPGMVAASTARVRCS